MSMKNSKDTIGNRTRDLPACRGVPQPQLSGTVLALLTLFHGGVSSSYCTELLLGQLAL